MEKNPLHIMGSVPFDISVLRTLFPHCNNIADKAKRMEEAGDIIRLKRGLYIAQTDGVALSRELVANHIYGPSYVSLSWALRYYGLIPERVFRLESVTTKHTRDFENALGVFHYQNCSPAYFPIGVTTKAEQNIRYLIATPEKALCDYVCFHRVSLRSRRDVGAFLEEDLRFDTDVLPELNLDIISLCSELGRSSGSLSMLLRYLQHERRV